MIDAYVPVCALRADVGSWAVPEGCQTGIPKVKKQAGNTVEQCDGSGHAFIFPYS